MAARDPDLDWLLRHVPPRGSPTLHEERAARVEALLEGLIESHRLPFTVGLFGGWGSGKTTFLSILAKKLLAKRGQSYKLVYFNAWKYAGFMEIVPSLIYKILRHGNYDRTDAEKLIWGIMVSLGKEYSDKVGQWAEGYTGVNPVREALRIGRVVKEGLETVPERTIEAYYTQIDKAQDLLVKVFKDPDRVTIVLIDELDRCDPDEAFAVIKQLRVLFAMRKLPIVFVVCANPDPIGCAIKHRYGLSTRSGDYEARRILEKFVDVYVDTSEPLALQEFVEWLWKEQTRLPGNAQGKSLGNAAALIGLEAGVEGAGSDPTGATALGTMKTDISLYSNLRLLRKSLECVSSRRFLHWGLLWAAWHLEIAEQMEPAFRGELRRVSSDIGRITAAAHEKLFAEPVVVHDGRFMPQPHPHRESTLFGRYRSFFWEQAIERLNHLREQNGPQESSNSGILRRWLADYKKMDFLILLSLLPFEQGKDARASPGSNRLPALTDNMKRHSEHLESLLASY